MRNRTHHAILNVKFVSEFKWLNGDLAFTNFAIQKSDRQKTNRNKKLKTLNFLPPGCAESQPYHTWNDDRGPVYDFCILKTSGDLKYSFATREH